MPPPKICKRGHPRVEPGRCRKCKRLKDRESYLKMKDIPKRALLEKFFDVDRKRAFHARNCTFQHRMRQTEPGVWYCDDDICHVLVVSFDRIQNERGWIGFSEDECQDYLAGKQTLRELIYTRI